MSNLVFLFGAGLSKPAGLPLGGEITDVLLKGENLHRHTSGRYLLGPHPSRIIASMDDYVERILLLLQIVRTEADVYYFGDRKVNYEDLYFMVLQVRDSISREEDNPVAHHYAKTLDDLLRDFLAKDHFTEALTARAFPPNMKIRYRHDVATLAQLCDESLNYMRDIVCQLLSKQTEATGYLRWIPDAATDSAFAHVSFFTLNYDALVERVLAERNVAFVDGFADADPDTGVRSFDATRYEKELTRPHLIKLHGSLDWFTNRARKPELQVPFRVVRVVDAKQAAKHFELRAPMVLIGTHNKPRSYAGPLFEDQHYRFASDLKQSSKIVVCGYSFGDKAINTRLIYWMDDGSDRRMTLIHPNPDLCKKGARPGFSRSWDLWDKQGRLSVIESGAENIIWKELKNAL
jgi:hypothetical protein